MALTQLTWNMVGPVPITSASATVPQSLEPNAATKPKAYVMSTLKSLILSSSYWDIDVQDVTGSATEALVLKPRAALSSIPTMRIVCTMNVSSALGGATAGSFMNDRTAGTADTTVSNRLMVGLTPDNSPSPTWVTGSWNSDRPWGNTVRWSKYWAIPSSGDANIDQMYLIESSEVLWIGLKGRRGNGAHYGALVGAIVASYDSGSGEQDGRVYGMSVIGTTMTTIFQSSLTSGPYGHSTTANADHTCVFIVSGGVTNGPVATGGANANQTELVTKLYTTTPSGYADGGDRGERTTAENNLVGIPIPLISNQSPVRLVGYARQIYSIQDFPGLLPLATGVNNPVIVGYTLGADAQNSNDALFFSNT